MQTSHKITLPLYHQNGLFAISFDKNVLCYDSVHLETNAKIQRERRAAASNIPCQIIIVMPPFSTVRFRRRQWRNDPERDGKAGNIQIAVYDAETLELIRICAFDGKSGQTEVSGFAVDPDRSSIRLCSRAEVVPADGRTLELHSRDLHVSGTLGNRTKPMNHRAFKLKSRTLRFLMPIPTIPRILWKPGIFDLRQTFENPPHIAT